jgi:hypothetical protein
VAQSEYIETELVLDALDLIQIETVIKNRIEEFIKAKEEANDGNGLGWLHENMANEVITNYRQTLRKIKEARKEIKRIKTESDAKFYADLKARRTAKR